MPSREYNYEQQGNQSPSGSPQIEQLRNALSSKQSDRYKLTQQWLENQFQNLKQIDRELNLPKTQTSPMSDNTPTLKRQQSRQQALQRLKSDIALRKASKFTENDFNDSNRPQQRSQLSKTQSLREQSRRLHQENTSSEYNRNIDQNRLVNKTKSYRITSQQPVGRAQAPQEDEPARQRPGRLPSNIALPTKIPQKSIETIPKTHSFQNQYQQSAHIMPNSGATQAQNEQPSEYPDVIEELHKCPTCGKSFKKSSLERHQRICQKVFVNKRKQFDSKSKTLGDFAQASQSKSYSSVPKSTQPIAAKSKYSKQNSKNVMPASRIPKWKQQSEQFRAGLRAGRGADSVKSGGTGNRGGAAGSAQRAEVDDRVSCPSCNRKFSADAAERHIPGCKARARKKGMRF